MAEKSPPADGASPDVDPSAEASASGARKLKLTKPVTAKISLSKAAAPTEAGAVGAVGAAAVGATAATAGATGADASSTNPSSTPASSTSAPAPWELTRKLVVVAAALVALVVVAGVGIGIGTAITGGSGAPQSDIDGGADDDSSVNDSGTGTEVTPDPVETEPSAPSVAPVTFSSVSGNLRCYVDAAVAWCHQGAIEYAVPAQNCASEGVAVGVAADGGAYWPCVAARPALTPALAYDTPFVHGSFTCVINYTTGATCTNEQGRGFTIEYKTGVATF